MLGEDLAGPGVTTIDALRAIESAVASIEVVDSRIADWRISLADTVADNASSARVAWLANTLGGLGSGLRAGDVVMSGALHRAFDVASGDTVRAEFDGLGPVSVRFA